MIKNPTVFRVLDCSTGHITAKDNKLLREDRSPIIVAHDYEFGYFVYVPEDIDEEGILAEGFSPSFVKLMKEAKTGRFDYIMLDRDGIQYDELEIFDW